MEQIDPDGGLLSPTGTLELTTTAGRATARVVPAFAEILSESHPTRGDQERKEARRHGMVRTASLKADQVLRQMPSG